MRSCAFLIPYRSQGTERDKILGWTSARLKALFPEFNIYFGDSDPTKPFNRSEARNNAFKKCTEDYVAFLDADTAWNADSLWCAFEKMDDGAPWVIPYDRYVITSEEGGSRILHSQVTEELEPIYDYLHLITAGGQGRYGPPIAGFAVMHAEDFLKTGGWDERFIGWGFEDNAFVYAADQTIGLHERCPGYIYHIWHPVADNAKIESPEIEPNRHLYGLYLQDFESNRANFL